jgi:hypothetical protein
MLMDEFERQVDGLLARGYAEAAGISEHAFLEYVSPLRARVEELAVPFDTEEGRLPFVIVVRSELVPTERAMPMVVRDGKQGFIGMPPVTPGSFRAIDEVSIPESILYLVFDIDRGRETLNMTPDQALSHFRSIGRSPLTIDEGVAILTHYPEFLQKNNCFSLLASRGIDRRVPALWISDHRPRLGWCWAGAPHTWLGSASCGGRCGAYPVLALKARSTS